MKTKLKILGSLALVVILTVVITGLAIAEDGELFRRNISKTPEGETGKAGIAFMNFVVPASSAAGDPVTIEYLRADGTLYETSDYVKPLIAIYTDDIGHQEEDFLGSLKDSLSINEPTIIQTGIGFGYRDLFMAHSLDDGATWKTLNISRSADLSSFNLQNGHAYPGDVYNGVQAIAGKRVMAAWLSRYCDGGTPLYTLVDEDGYIDAMQLEYSLPNLYLYDIWGVTGTQKSVDYTLQGFPEVGEVPYGCVWTARGTLVEDPENPEIYGIAWTKPERLTSGVRDPNRLEVSAVAGAGFAITWQEDPEGLRPGQGLGPGDGWSGAIVNAKTDIWYSYVSWDDFGLVDTDGVLTTVEEATLIEEYIGESLPKPAVPMAMPIRLTDNDMCKYNNPENTTTPEFAYCYTDFDDVTGDIVTINEAPTSSSDFCVESVDFVKPDGSTLPVCRTADERILDGRVGSSRARMSLQPYTKADGSAGAWLVMAYEESKALGDIMIDDEPIEIGKNVWYHTFDMFKPEVVAQGGMLNQPISYNPETQEQAAAGEFLTFLDNYDNTVYQTEIARRFSMVVQPVGNIGDTRTSAFLIYKQGIINQGGPADIFARRVVVPAEAAEEGEEGFDPTVDNPYLFEYIACDNWILGPGENPNYVEGLCGDPAINFSAANIVAFDDASACDMAADPSDPNACVNVFPWEGGVQDFPRVAEWLQTEENLDDQSYENPFDVAKGHRGFLDGDFLMVMYAWSPNWKANTVGNDKYNLYTRRSFDGGQTWTTTPTDWCTPDGVCGSGTETCENYGVGIPGSEVVPVCTWYPAGEFEQARNVSQLTGTKVTVLDPRYTPTGGLRKVVVKPYVDDYLDTSAFPIDPEDEERDPSKYFVVFETGDNTVVADMAAIPLDLFYSRAEVYGDTYEVEEVFISTGSGQEIEGRWPWLENKHDDLSGEAGLTSSPSGDFFYAVWNQWQELEPDVITNSDIIFRRVMYIDEEVADPQVKLLYLSSAMITVNDELLIIATAYDGDHANGIPTEDIAEEVWTLTYDGVTTIVGADSTLRMPPGNLHPGWQHFQFKAKDKGGRWSPGLDVMVYVSEAVYKYFMPVIVAP